MTQKWRLVIAVALLVIGIQLIAQQKEVKSPGVDDPAKPVYKLPDRGLCAHRGAMDTHPENTLAAFRAAIRTGVQMIELDVCLTKDHQMVVLHDATVNRTTNGQGKAADLTLHEIKRLEDLQ